MKTVRHAAVAGSFYPAERAVLARALTTHLTRARADQPEDTGRVPKAVIVPHAGYVYSGPMAARAYARLEPGAGTIERVVLLGPTHRVPVRGLALPGVDLLRTPLGDLEVDAAGCARAAQLPQVVTSATVHELEHSLEVQLPFLSAVLGAVLLVPLAVGSASAQEVAEVIDALWGGPETVVVISSDLSHYLPQEVAVPKDEETLAQILSLDPTIRHDQACGATPLNGMLLAARRRGMRPEALGRCTSADTAGQPDRVVGYCAVALHEPAPDQAEGSRDTTRADVQPPEVQPPDGEHADGAVGAAAARAAARDGGTDAPPPDAGDTLLPLARRAIARAVGAEPGRPADLVPEEPAWLTRPGAAFVTLRDGGRLRGCIGSLSATRALGRDVVENAVAAATWDPRFKPVEAHELERLSVEVSVLSSPEPLEATSEADVLARLRPGVDGVILRLGPYRPTFLPQVWEELPTPVEFLGRLKRKAGLPEDFWHDDMTVETYEVRAWSEP